MGRRPTVAQPWLPDTKILLQALNPADKYHARLVWRHYMRRRRQITIRCIENPFTLGLVLAVEGSHRLYLAASRVVPVHVEVYPMYHTFTDVEICGCPTTADGFRILRALTDYHRSSAYDEPETRDYGTTYEWSPRTKLVVPKYYKAEA